MNAYEQARSLSSSDQNISIAFKPIEQIFEDKKIKPDACIMVYGVYNAGKSTLINVLLGHEEARVGDIPMTDQVDSYRWGKYSILDTPGVDAPIEHEQVTKAQMLKADVIIFVVNPLGTIEEEATLNVLVDLLVEKKQIFMVFNDKNGLTDQDFIKLKDQTREQLQKIGYQRGLNNILKEVPIVRINAQFAFIGQTENQPELIEASGYPILKNQLEEFLDTISPDEIYDRLKNQLLLFLQKHIDFLESQRGDNNIVKKFDKFSQQIIREKANIYAEVARSIEQERKSIYEKTKRTLRTYPENCQSKIEEIMEYSNNQLHLNLNNQLQQFISITQNDINELQKLIPKIEFSQEYKNHKEIPINVESNELTLQNPELNNHQGIPTTDIAIKASKQLVSLARPEHVVTTLKTVKEFLPSLMKGIGPKTMEKWAGAVVGKFIPYIGTILTVGMALKDIFSGDSEEAAMRQQIEEQRRARERAEQQMDDFAQELADDFKQFMQNNIFPEIDDFFAQLNNQVDKLRDSFSEQERFVSDQLQKWLSVQQIALKA